MIFDVSVLCYLLSSKALQLRVPIRTLTSITELQQQETLNTRDNTLLAGAEARFNGQL